MTDESLRRPHTSTAPAQFDRERGSLLDRQQGSLWIQLLGPIQPLGLGQASAPSRGYMRGGECNPVCGVCRARRRTVSLLTRIGLTLVNSIGANPGIGHRFRCRVFEVESLVECISATRRYRGHVVSVYFEVQACRTPDLAIGPLALGPLLGGRPRQEVETPTISSRRSASSIAIVRRSVAPGSNCGYSSSTQ